MGGGAGGGEETSGPGAEAAHLGMAARPPEVQPKEQGRKVG